MTPNSCTESESEPLFHTGSQAHGGKGGERAAIDISRAGRTPKFYVLTDALGRQAVVRLTAGNVSDINAADELIGAAGPVRRPIADRG